MNILFAQLWIAMIKSMAHLSMLWRKRIAWIIAQILWYFVPMRKHVTLRNLRLCFPEKTEDERIALGKNNYRCLARAVIDHGLLWTGTKEEIQSFVQFDNIDEVLNGLEQPTIIVAPHFAGLDAAGIALNTRIRGVSLYQKQSNSAWDKVALEGRKRFSDPILIAKSKANDLRPVIRAMKQGLPFYYLPDMDHGKANSIFVPFFGVPAATIPMVSRLAKLLKARVIFSVTEMTSEGYVVHFDHALENFPTDDPEKDTQRINEILEQWIRRFPDQYMWTHRRFKTRPDGEKSLY